MRKLALLLLACSLAACGGGGASAPAGIPAAAPTGAAAGRAQLRITIPGSSSSSSSIRRAYVGSDAAGLAVGVGPHGGALTTQAFSLTGTACTTVSGGRSCTVAVTAPFGNDDFSISVYDAAPVGGVIPASAHLLGTASESNVAIVAGAAPTAIAVVLAAQVGAFSGGASMVTLPADGATHAAAVLLVPADFNDQPITGSSTTYANPISVSLAETSGSGHTQLTINGSPAGTSATLTGSSQALGVSYDGGGGSGYYATVTLAASGATSASFDVVPIYISTTSQYYAAGALTFNGSSQSASFSVNEAVGSNTYANSAPASGCSGVATSTGSGASGTVIFTSASAAASPCALEITDSLGGAYAIPYTTTTSSGGITVGGVTEYATSHGSPFAITAGPDGNLWVMENNSIEKLTTGGIEAASYNQGNSIGAITPGTNGNLYFVYGYASLSEITTAGVTTSVSTGTYALNGIAQDEQGDLWVVDQFDGLVEEFSSNLQFLASYSVVAQPAAGIALGSDGRIYLPDGANGMVYAFTPGSGSSQTYSLAAGCTAPQQIVSDPKDGNLYISCAGSNSIVQLQTNGTQGNYTIGQADSPRGMAVGPDGSIWFAGYDTDTIGRLTVPGLLFSHVTIPTANALPEGVALGADGRIWFTEYGAQQVGAFVP